MSADLGTIEGRPLPVLEGLAGEFYGWCNQGELRFQRCDACQQWRHVPRPLCAACGSWDWTWTASSGRGEIYTWTTVDRPMHPAFQDAQVFAAVVVAMNEGVRLLSRVIDRDPHALEIGMPVHVDFERLTPEIALPVFRSEIAANPPASSAASSAPSPHPSPNRSEESR